MRIAVVQSNTTVGDLEGNTQKIIASITNVEQKADLIVFPELTITGYPPRDLLFKKEFVDKNKEMLSKIVKTCVIPCVVGFVDSHDKNIYNAAALIVNKEIVGIQHKILLPNYDVFDEERYFTPGDTQNLYTVDDKKVGIAICEDLWEQHYPVKPTSTLQQRGADIIVNISASPYCVGKLNERLTIAQSFCTDFFVCCNVVGGQDELVFDGQSFVLQKGKLIALGKAFKEDFFVINTEKVYPEIKPVFSETKNVFNALVLGIKDYCRKTHFERVVLGMSGGIDSSLVACLAVEALGNTNVTGLFMPSRYTSAQSKKGAETVAQNLGISLVTVPIDGIVGAYTKGLQNLFTGLPEDITEENIQARIRGNVLMAFSNKFGHLVLVPGNKTELALGYCTLYGDMCGGLSVIGDVSKMHVYELARYYNTLKGKIIPESVLTRAPSAELKDGQIDPFDYAVVSPLVDLIIEDEKSKKELVTMGYDPGVVDDVYQRIVKSEYKRWQAPPVIKVTKKAFGNGRRYPLATQFR